MPMPRPKTSPSLANRPKPRATAGILTSTLPVLGLLFQACQAPSPTAVDPRDGLARDGISATLPPCTDPGEPSAEAYAVSTEETDDGIILPNGRAITPTGTQLTVGTFPLKVISDRAGKYAYITNNGDGVKSIQQLDIAGRKSVARLELGGLFNGLALDSTGTRLYAAAGSEDTIYVLEVGDPGLKLLTSWTVGKYPTDIAVSPDGSRLLVSANLGQTVYELDATSGAILRELSVDKMPYQIVYAPDGQRAYVSQWDGKAVAVLDLTTGRVTDTFSTVKNPSAMALTADGSKLYVAGSDGDVIEVFDTQSGRNDAQIPVGIYAEGMHGVSPVFVLLAEDKGLFYVGNAGDNAVEVYDLASNSYQGAIPTGWYPTAGVITPDGQNLLIANGKGQGAPPNPDQQEASDKLLGTVSFVSLPLDGTVLSEGDTQVSINNSRAMTLHEIDCAGKSFPIPSEGGSTPIEHVVFILRENKTYDAYLGDLEVGDGDPSLTLFGETITPNTHALAREYCLLDNFYTDSEDSDQGHLWATSAFVNDFSERHNANGRVLATGVLPASDTPTHYIFDNLLRHGIDWVNYGEIVGIEVPTVHNMDLKYPGVVYNTNVKDQEKAEYVVSRIEAGKFPPYTFLSLPCDHTNGTDPGSLSPESMVSDNDYAVGLVVDAITKSPYWSSTVIFILEDDPQTGGDHVEAHRSPAIVVSPWTKRNYVSSVHYSMLSMHRSTELILGMSPMNQYDAMATPMYDCFTATPDYTPYDVIPRQVPDTYNTLSTYGAEESSRMDFTGPDRNPGLGRLLWRYMKGTEPPKDVFGDPRERAEDEDEDWE